ncbi:MAG: bifunctional diguanylate cyclase/phosphodiesterase [Paracoccaceae bacterium]|jgi:diguanylate cyclase (GGDEF)-like protein|nr:bifunctional diguanylate cyclase/phosphodiesterase [Paracoccaceae bacterium]
MDDSPASSRFFVLLSTRLGSRVAAGVAILILICMGIGGAFKVQAALKEVAATRAVFEVPIMREGFMAMNDIDRLNSVVQQAKASGSISAADRDAFEFAIDLLVVRVGSFERLVRANPTRATSRAYDALVHAADRANQETQDGFRGLFTFANDFLELASEARVALVSYLDNARHLQTDALERQSQILFSLTLFLITLLIGMTLIGTCAILLLRREVALRHGREQAERRADYLAHFDLLTGLPNRQKFQEHLDDQLAQIAPMSMLLLDLDDFKGINDTYGHAAGDAVLRRFAERLSKRVTSYNGLAARLGGDEFAVILPQTDPATLRRFCGEFVQDMERPIRCDGLSLLGGFCLGLATSKAVSNGKNLTAECLLRATDIALYEAKEAGRGAYKFYDASMEKRTADRRALLDAIPKALDAKEFFVVYQPKINLETLEVYGFEALIRWNRDGVVVPPEEFIPLAEEHHLIKELDLYVMEHAVQQLVDWNRGSSAPLSVSVNLSGLHFVNARIVDHVRRILKETNLPPHLLTLEITETVLLDDWTSVSNVLDQLRELGPKISLDDFGTGFSSLAYLRSIAADELKIDRSFVTELVQSQEARFVLDAVVDIARGLGMTIVVEGIETDAQADIVRDFGCHNAQGFLFGGPKDATTTFDLYLSNRTKLDRAG